MERFRPDEAAVLMIERDGKKSNRGWKRVQLLEATELNLGDAG